VKTGVLRRDIRGAGWVSDLAVAGNTIAVVAGGNDRRSPDEAAMSRGDALVFRFGL
jgi:hypothetical protein